MVLNSSHICQEIKIEPRTIKIFLMGLWTQMSSGNYFDASRSKTFTPVKILDALGDYIWHCKKVFLKNESKSFIQRIRKFHLW
jgi:hypothetical protein